MFRRIFATLGVASAALLGAVVPASAQPDAAPHCQYGSSYGTIVKTAPVSATTGGARVGTVELCRDSAYNYWGFVIYDNEMTASQYAQVILQIYRDGSWTSEVTCDSPNGNDHVEPGQTRCWTPKVGGVSGRYTFRAWSEKYSSHTGALLAWGHTVIAR
ncbi:hypothetical protein [Amycolatopsis sp. YIM 10]|uniref:hypothetical protein n=1 Tax=Amycolatopsis sp. YIM 10 TaxID=2653857 RepID=UPI00129073F0|nr:hypothetical protein [Amycolatopsis sp. YIM 10]QFU92572.1 hypothetical protein YIM_37065 [Amycolatopsis sp. YIM 10]